MFSKNIYLAIAVFMFVLLAIVYFQNVAYWGSFMVFLFDSSGGSLPQYMWPLVLIAAIFGASATLYIQKLMDDMDVDNQSGGLNI